MRTHQLLHLPQDLQLLPGPKIALAVTHQVPHDLLGELGSTILPQGRSQLTAGLVFLDCGISLGYFFHRGARELEGVEVMLNWLLGVRTLPPEGSVDFHGVRGPFLLRQLVQVVINSLRFLDAMKPQDDLG